jgi:hypothetical protein
MMDLFQFFLHMCTFSFFSKSIFQSPINAMFKIFQITMFWHFKVKKRYLWHVLLQFFLHMCTFSNFFNECNLQNGTKQTMKELWNFVYKLNYKTHHKLHFQHMSINQSSICFGFLWFLEHRFIKKTLWWMQVSKNE